MTEIMYAIAVSGLLWLAFALFRHASIGGLIIRVPTFLFLGYIWLLSVTFGSLLLEAFVEIAGT